MSRAIQGSPAAERRLALPAVGTPIAVLAAAGAVGVTVMWITLAALDHRMSDAIIALAAASFAIMGAVLVVKRVALPVGWILVIAGLSMASLGGSQEYARHTLEVSPGSLPAGDFAAWLSNWFPIVTNGLLFGVLPQLYPDGRLLSRRWRISLGAGIAFIVLAATGNAFLPQNVEGLANVTNPYAIASLKPLFSLCILLSAPAGLVAVAGGIISLVIRWRRTRGDERQQINWFMVGAVPAAVGALVIHSFDATAGDIWMSLTLPLIPLALGVAILRYRLYDLKFFVNRAIVYALLSAAVVAIYLVIVTVVERLVGGGRSLSIQAAATVIAAAAFQPLRSRAQRVVDELFYGQAARPYEALSRLGERLEIAPVPETVLTTIVRTVADVLQLPGAAIEFRDGGGWRPAAAFGTLGTRRAAFPMVYQGEVIGQLIAGCRGPAEDFRPRDARLLADLARQAGVAAHAVQVTDDLLRSRAALVTAREEERRRLRRDLHDGLGPTLAGVTLGLHAVRSNMRRDMDASDELLTQLEAQMEEAVRDIRQLVYGLRPPALDEVGLVRALQQQAARLEGSAGLTIVVQATPPQLDQLPAAVEVAAYRIALEAMTNAVRHGQASVCAVDIALDGHLELLVTDNGTGMDESAAAGVGLHSMRERAAELGGSIDVRSSHAGTSVRAALPLVGLHE